MKKIVITIKKEDGQSLIMVALLMVVLLGFAAISIDIGMLSLSKARLQNAADAAALAGSQELPDKPDLAKTIAQNYVTSNGTSGDIATVTIGGDNKSITVSVTRTDTLFFGKVLGVNTSTASADATASTGVAASVPWIVPFVIAKPAAFDYTKVYVMRMYGSGDFLDYSSGYPNKYSYPDDYRNDSVYKKYSTTSPYPYQLDYMNVYIKKDKDFDTDFENYIGWLKNGYHETFSINQNMYYMAPSSGGKESVDAFADRTSRDANTDYTRAKLGDARVMLIPVVEKMLKRDTKTDGTVTIKVIGFVGFFIKEVHKNSYGASFWFEGRFLKDLNIGSGEVTFDTSADFGLRAQKLTK